MDPEKQKALEDAGWRFGDASDFLEAISEDHSLDKLDGDPE